MSYGLDFIAPDTDENDPSALIAQQKERIIEAILELELGTKVFKLQDDYVELNHDNGIQVGLDKSDYWVTVPYWHSGEKAEAVFLQIQKILLIIQDITKYEIHDSQIGDIIDARKDFDLMLETYLGAMGQIRKIFP
jgi:hypothetical protein